MCQKYLQIYVSSEHVENRVSLFNFITSSAMFFVTKSVDVYV